MISREQLQRFSLASSKARKAKDEAFEAIDICAELSKYVAQVDAYRKACREFSRAHLILSLALREFRGGKEEVRA